MREEPAWKNRKVLTTLLLVFAAGAGSGALSMRLGLHEKLHRTMIAASPQNSREAVLQNFKSKLNLSPEQTEKIAQVLEDYRMYYRSLQEQLDDLRSMGKQRIVQVLDPEQQKKFDKLMNDLDPQLAPSVAK